MKLYSFKKLSLIVALLSTQIAVAESHFSYGDEYHRKVYVQQETSKTFEPMWVNLQKSFRQRPERIWKDEDKKWLADLIDKSKCVDDAMREFVKLFYGPDADPTIQSILKLEGISSVTPKIFISLEPQAIGTACSVPGVGIVKLRPYLSVTDTSIDALTDKLKISKVNVTLPEILLPSKEQKIKSEVDPNLADKVKVAVHDKLVSLKEIYKKELKNIEVQENHPVFRAMTNK